MLSNCIIRKAVASDEKKIKQMVQKEWLNPIGLDWQNFWIIEREKALIACGQLRSWGNIRELSSLVVLPKHRRKGIGTHLVKCLIEKANTVVYLSCGNKFESFYALSGFEQIPWSKLPISLKFEFGLSTLIAVARGKQLMFMKHE